MDELLVRSSICPASKLPEMLEFDVRRLSESALRVWKAMEELLSCAVTDPQLSSKRSSPEKDELGASTRKLFMNVVDFGT